MLNGKFSFQGLFNGSIDRNIVDQKKSFTITNTAAIFGESFFSKNNPNIIDSNQKKKKQRKKTRYSKPKNTQHKNRTKL